MPKKDIFPLNLPISELPADEEPQVYAYFSDEEFVVQEISSFEGNYTIDDDPEDLDFELFFRLTSEVAVRHFLESWRKLKPWIRIPLVKQVQIVFDFGFLTSAEASLLSKQSDPGIGKFTFTLSTGILNEYLKEHWSPGYAMDPYPAKLWDHELIHIPDSRNDGIRKKLMYSQSLGKWILGHLLRFRSEGIADLAYTLRGHGKHKDFVSAIFSLHEEIIKITHLELPDRMDGRAASLFLKGLEKDSPFYSAGAWMVLHMLQVINEGARFGQISGLVERLQNGETIPDEEIFPLVNHAIHTDCYTFIRSLTNPGIIGRPFLDPGDFTQLGAWSGQIKSHPFNRQSPSSMELINNLQVDALVALYNQFAGK